MFGQQPNEFDYCSVTTRYVSLGLLVFFCLTGFGLAMMRGLGLPCEFVRPYLLGCAMVSLIPAVAAWWLALRCRAATVGRLLLAGAAFYVVFSFAAGAGVTVAEDMAAAAAVRSGYNPGMNGPRDFYPNDSGMSHWPTEWHAVPSFMAAAAVLFVPLFLGLTAAVAALDERVGCRRQKVTVDGEEGAGQKQRRCPLSGPYCTYACLAAVTMVAGLLSRADFPMPRFIALYAGDALWAMLIYWGFRLLAPARAPIGAAGAAVVFAFAIEFSQLYQAPWLNQIRDTTLGGLILGYGFKISDLALYALGITAGACLDRYMIRFACRRQTKS